MQRKLRILALSIDPSKLKRRLIDTLYRNYDKESIKKYGFEVVCQGFSDEDYNYLVDNYPEMIFHRHDKIKGSISYIRNYLAKEYNLFTESEYTMLIDDDFSYGAGALNQYDFYIKEMDKNPSIGMVAFHRRMSKSRRLDLSPLEFPYPHDLGIISMRNGLLIRNSSIPDSGLFDDRIIYHEEMYIAFKIYINGYDIAKGWLDIYHQSNSRGLGCKLQKEHSIYTNKEVPSSKKIIYDMGYLELDDSGQFYRDGGNCCKLNERAVEEHNKNRIRLEG